MPAPVAMERIIDDRAEFVVGIGDADHVASARAGVEEVEQLVRARIRAGLVDFALGVEDVAKRDRLAGAGAIRRDGLANRPLVKTRDQRTIRIHRATADSL